MGWLFCCAEFSIVFGSDTDLRTRYSELNKGRANSGKPEVTDYRFSIQEDSILEDMCELAEVEFDGDPETMSAKDKSKLLKRLSKNPQTEQYFKSERALSHFIEQKLNIRIPELERKTHLGIFRDKSHGGRMSASKSRISLGVDSRISNVHNKTLSKVSLSGLPQQTSRMSNTVGNSPSQQIFLTHRLSQQQLSTNSLTSNGSILYGPKTTKRKSTTYDIATDVIKKDHQKSINSASTSSNRKESGSFLKNIFNTSNSIYTEKHEKKFGSASDKNKKHRKIR